MKRVFVVFALLSALVLTGCLHHRHRGHHKYKHGIPDFTYEEKILLFKNQHPEVNIETPKAPEPPVERQDTIVAPEHSPILPPPPPKEDRYWWSW